MMQFNSIVIFENFFSLCFLFTFQIGRIILIRVISGAAALVRVGSILPAVVDVRNRIDNFVSSCIPGSIFEHVRGSDVSLTTTDGTFVYNRIAVGRLTVGSTVDTLFVVPEEFHQFVLDRLLPYSFDNCTAAAVQSLPSVQIRFMRGYIELHPSEFLYLNTTTSVCRPQYNVIAPDARVTILPETFPYVRTLFLADRLLLGESRNE